LTASISQSIFGGEKFDDEGEKFMANLIHVTDNSFDAQVLKCDIPVLAGFWPEWSGSGKKVEAFLTEITAAYPQQLKLVKVDIEANPLVTSNYRVLTVPTLILFKNAQPVAQLTGVVSKEMIIEQVVPYLDE
jgi:thioredoxin 1